MTSLLGALTIFLGIISCYVAVIVSIMACGRFWTLYHKNEKHPEKNIWDIVLFFEEIIMLIIIGGNAFEKYYKKDKTFNSLIWIVRIALLFFIASLVIYAIVFK